MVPELVNGTWGEPHVTSYQEAMINSGITGYDNVIFGHVGKALKAEVLSANKIRIYDGAAMIGGKVFCIKAGEYADIAIESGENGKYRSDLICVKYEKDKDGNESTSFEVVQGTSGSSYIDPEVTKNDLYSIGTTSSQEKLYRVKIDGFAIVEVELLFNEVVTNAELNSNLSGDNVVSKSKAGYYGDDGVFTADRDGILFASYSLTTTTLNNASTGYVQLQIEVNNVIIASDITSAGGHYYDGASCFGIAKVNKGDTITFGAPRNTDSSNSKSYIQYVII